jgi:hypothetical protein
MVRPLAGRHLRQHPTGVLPEAILLVAILEVDPETAREDGQVVLDSDRALRFEPTDEALTAVVDRREDPSAARGGPADFRANQPVPDVLTELGLDRRRADPPESRLGLNLDVAKTGHRLQEATAGGTLAPSRLALGMGVEGDAGVHPVSEPELRKAGGQELRHVTHWKRPLELLDLVVEVDARGAPHHDLGRPVSLEQLDRAVVHPAGRSGVAVLVMHDAAAVRRPPDGDVVEAEAVEDRRRGANHVGVPQYVASKIENDLVRVGVVARRLESPRALLRQGREVVGQPDLAEVPSVVVGHLDASPSTTLTLGSVPDILPESGTV